MVAVQLIKFLSTKMVIYTTTVVLLLMATPVIKSQTNTDCPMVETSDLGSTTGISSTGLLAASLLSIATDNAAPSVQLLEFNTVCLTQGSRSGLYSFTSIVARYRNSDGTEETIQVDYQCTANAWSQTILGSSGVVTTSPAATLTTTLRNDCGTCISPSTLPSDLINHCIGTAIL